ncbi:hypothetical protein DSECCO2_636660 [anaerobic digester metagenome]
MRGDQRGGGNLRIARGEDEVIAHARVLGRIAHALGQRTQRGVHVQQDVLAFGAGGDLEQRRELDEHFHRTDLLAVRALDRRNAADVEAAPSHLDALHGLAGAVHVHHRLAEGGNVVGNVDVLPVALDLLLAPQPHQTAPVGQMEMQLELAARHRLERGKVRGKLVAQGFTRLLRHGILFIVYLAGKRRGVGRLHFRQLRKQRGLFQGLRCQQFHRLAHLVGLGPRHLAYEDPLQVRQFVRQKPVCAAAQQQNRQCEREKEFLPNAHHDPHLGDSARTPVRAVELMILLAISEKTTGRLDRKNKNYRSGLTRSDPKAIARHQRPPAPMQQVCHHDGIASTS